MKKYFIVFLFVIVLMGVAIYLIATDDIMLLNPKMIVSNYQTCQKMVSTTETYRGSDSGVLCVSSKHIGCNDGYDYYFESYFNSPKYIADYFVKKKRQRNYYSFLYSGTCSGNEAK